MVLALCETTPNRALFVSDLPMAARVPACEWSQVTGWRTTDDRIFAWIRGDREPDSSFRSVAGASATCSWRGLSWDEAKTFSKGATAPGVGRAIFAAPGSPSLLGGDLPAFPIAPVPSWWGVTTKELEKARKRIRAQTPLLPEDGNPALIKVLTNATAPLFLLNVRTGSLSGRRTPKRWTSKVTVRGVRLNYREEWARLYVDDDMPVDAAEGDAWIRPDGVSVSLRGGSITIVSAVCGPRHELVLDLELQIDFKGAIDDSSGQMHGSWNPNRSITATLSVRKLMGQHWETARRVEAAISLIAPLPFCPTVLISESERLVAVAPETEDRFEAPGGSAGRWNAVDTPTMLLPEEGHYQIIIFDGTVLPDGRGFGDVGTYRIADVSVDGTTDPFCRPGTRYLDDGLSITQRAGGEEIDVVAFRIKERSANLSSGLLSIVRGLPVGRKQPSTEARESVLGRYQVRVAEAISRSGNNHNSLYQYVISSTAQVPAWPTHEGTPIPTRIGEGGLSDLPGLGHGPSGRLTASAEWSHFMSLIGRVVGALGIATPSGEIWISGVDAGALGASLARDYLAAHRALVSCARLISAADGFWATYPFSAVIVEGRHGAAEGQLQAVLLSPLHPVRLGMGILGCTDRASEHCRLRTLAAGRRLELSLRWRGSQSHGSIPTDGGSAD